MAVSFLCSPGSGSGVIQGLGCYNTKRAVRTLVILIHLGLCALHIIVSKKINGWTINHFNMRKETV